LDANHAAASSIRRILADVYGKQVFHNHVGAGMPVVAEFNSILKKPIAMVSLCNDDCNMHGVEENFSVYHMTKALEFVNKYWKKNETS